MMLLHKFQYEAGLLPKLLCHSMYAVCQDPSNRPAAFAHIQGCIPYLLSHLLVYTTLRLGAAIDCSSATSWSDSCWTQMTAIWHLLCMFIDKPSGFSLVHKCRLPRLLTTMQRCT